MILRQIIIISILFIFIPASVSLSEDTDKKGTSYFNESWLKAVVSIEVILESGEEKPIGTGFLIESPNKHILLVTAKHVISDNQGNIIGNLAIRLNDKFGKSFLLTEEVIKKLNNGKWFLSETSDVACQFIYKKKTSDILFITLSQFLPSEKLNVGAPLVILGFPMGLRSDEFAIPIARSAMVAKPDSEAIMVDGFVFPGNSGGPVIYSPTVKFGENIIPGVLNEQRLVGLVSKSINFVDVAISQQTKRPRITFEDNSGLSHIISADKIIELISRKDVKETDKELK